jgi:hypothetical protein
LHAMPRRPAEITRAGASTRAPADELSNCVQMYAVMYAINRLRRSGVEHLQHRF